MSPLARVRRHVPIAAALGNKIDESIRELLRRFLFDPRDPKKVLFIVGCQRSGTTLMTRLFAADVRAKVFPEISELSSEDGERRLRLNPLEDVRLVLDRVAAPLVVLKPLVESQRVGKLLEYFPDSRALWMYRHYRAVAKSRLHKPNRRGLANQLRDLKAVVERRSDDWRYQGVPEDVAELVSSFYSPTMNGYDAAALFWYARNSTFYSQHLEVDERVRLCHYESLVGDPAGELHRVYDFLGLQTANSKVTRQVVANSLTKASDVVLHPLVEAACSSLYDRLRLTQLAHR